jgi:hypothetical protein
MPTQRGNLGFDGVLSVKVTRSRRPTFRQRVTDWLLSLRRFR